jgi:nucleoside-diphosphate-sugar epimerase
MRIVITGASGNVGTSVLSALGQDDDVEEIVGLARRVPRAQFPKTTWRQADVTASDLARLFAGADAVIHLAWLIQPSRDERTTRRVNVDGSARVFEAAARANVPSLVYASSIGAYSPGPDDRRVDESWPTGGVPSSFYSRHKAEVERLLDAFEIRHPGIRVVRLRPALIFKRSAASEIRRLFLGPLLPNRLLRPELLPVLPIPRGLRTQAVHSLDVGDAYRLAATRPVRGAFNLAAEPVLDRVTLARALRTRVVEVPARLVREAAAVSWRARLQPTPPGWLDMALALPLMDSTRALEGLGWKPRFGADDALGELLDGLREQDGLATPPLDPAVGGRFRWRELRSGVGGTA